MPKHALRGASSVSISIAVAVLFFILPAINALRFPHFAETQFLESDTYYYLDVARSSQHLPFFSFDAQKPTNGFHPLWQWIEYLSVKIGFLPLHDNWKTLQHVYFLDLGLLTIGVGLLTWFSLRRLHHAWLVLWIFCPGLLWFLLSHNSFFSVWSDLNGMETGVELLFFALTLLVFDQFQENQERSSVRWLVTANIVAGLMVLARLDDVFFLLPLTALTILSRRVTLRLKMLAASIPFFMLLAYVSYNRLTVGIFMPISGSHKAGWVAVQQLRTLLQYLLPVHSWKVRFPPNLNGEVYYHLLQMVVPAVVCALYLCWKWRRKSLRLDLLTSVALGVLLKASYNFVFVGLMLQGHWYYGPSIIVANLLLVLAIDRVISMERLTTMFSQRSGLYLGTASAGLSVLAFGFLMESYPGENDFPFYRIQMSGPALRSMIQSYGDQRFVEFDDGEIAFASGIPSVSGFGLTGDLESVHALQSGTFFPLMEKRGITLIASSWQYHRGTEDLHADQIQEGLWGGLRGSEFSKYYWKYLGSTQDIYFYRLTRD